MSLSWLTIVDSIVKKVSISLLVKTSKVLLSCLMEVYFSFLVFLISNYYSSSIFSGSPYFFYSFFSSFLVVSFFFGTLVYSNHSSTNEHSSKVIKPSSLNLILNVTPKVSSFGCWGLVTKYPICLLKPFTKGSYSIKISIASLRVNLIVLLVGTLAPT